MDATRRALQPHEGRVDFKPAAISVATGCLLLVLACRLDKLVKPTLHDRLIVTPAALQAVANSGSSIPDTQTLRFASADGATLTWTAVDNIPWLALSSSGGGAPDSITVTLLADTIPESIRHDTIEFVAAEMPGDTIRVGVTLTVLAPAPELSLSRGAYADSAFAGSLAARSFVLHIDNRGGLPLTWSASVDRAWIALSSASGGAPPSDSTIITLSSDTLTAGTHTGTVTISAPGAIGSPRTVDVTFRVQPCAQPPVTADALVTARLDLTDCGAPDRPGRLAKRFSVGASAGDSLSFRLTSSAFDAYLTLHDSLGAPLAENDDCSGSLTGASCILEFRAPAGGRYIVEATTLAPADTGAFTLSVVRERAPNTPQSITQLRADSATPIALGATNPDSVAIFKGTVNDPNPRDSVRLELEVVATSSPPSGTPTHQSAYVAAGQTAWIRVGGLSENAAYYWRARSCDRTLRCSAWVSFGGNADGATDFLVNAILENPSIGALSLNQFNGANVIPVGSGTGGGLGSAQTVTFKGTVSDPDPADILVIEVESKQTGNAFDATGLSRGTDVASGATASVAVGYSVGLLGANYHWRARACDQTGRCSAWAPFGGNSDAVTAATDFHVP